jgi:DNA-binding transcriptional ArsR family regulator
MIPCFLQVLQYCNTTKFAAIAGGGPRQREARARAMTGNPRGDDSERLRQFKAEFFKALAHPLRIRILELLRSGPLSVSQIQEVTGVPSSSVSQQLAVLRGRNILATERRGTTIMYRVADDELFDLLDVARRIFNAHLSEAIDMLRLVEDETVAAGER